MLPIKCVALGDGCAGKTSILKTFADGFFVEEYATTVYEEYRAAYTTSDGIKIPLLLCDTAGLDVRPLFYADTEVFLLCYSIAEPNALDNIRQRWLPEIRYYCPGVPVLLVATKIDLRNNNEILRGKGSKHITPEEGLALAKEIGAFDYLECSARCGKGLTEIFEFVTTCAMQQRSKSSGSSAKGKCLLM